MARTPFGRHLPGSYGFQDFSTGLQKHIRMTMMKMFKITIVASIEYKTNLCILLIDGPNKAIMNRTIEILLHVDEKMETDGAKRLYLIACSRSYGFLMSLR